MTLYPLGIAVLAVAVVSGRLEWYWAVSAAVLLALLLRASRRLALGVR